MNRQAFHHVGNRVWPISCSVGILCVAIGLVIVIHTKKLWLLTFGGIIVVLSCFF